MKILWSEGWEAAIIADALGRTENAIFIRAVRLGLPRRVPGETTIVVIEAQQPVRLLSSQAGWRTCLSCLSKGLSADVAKFWSTWGGHRRCPACSEGHHIAGLSWLADAEDHH